MTSFLVLCRRVRQLAEWNEFWGEEKNTRNSLRLASSLCIWLYVLSDRACLCDKINSHVYLHSMAHERAFQLRCELLLSVNIIYMRLAVNVKKRTNNVINARSLSLSRVLLSWDMIIDIRLLLLLVSDNDKWVKMEKKTKRVNRLYVCVFIQTKREGTNACVIVSTI